ncbi:uncharacterized protein LOC108666585 [Hyalella azteca]|uniref:Uncharacterized protein LOC108666585 n=1 Tax=Hyalella azteca TaxID=294128 RepID=A0A8B7N541_HYAAZ|nr:uncharacterized protein LOC108666585 [Hyalella azteca]
MKKTAKAAKKKTEEMEVDDSSHRDLASSAKEDPDLSDETVGVRVSDIPVSGPLPKGRWRLGVPCPTTTAILLRFANKDDLEKAQQMRWRMQDSGQDMKSTVRESHDSREPHKKSRRGVPSAVEAERGFAASPEERRIRRVKRSHHAGVKARLSGPKLGLPVMHPPGTAMPLYLPPRPEAYLPPLPPGVERTYRDLDDPVVEAVDSKDPWGSLAQNWGKRETGPSLDYQALLKSHRHALQGTKRKRDPDDDSGYDGARHNPRNLGRSRHVPTAARRAGDHRYEDSGGDDRHRSDEDDDGSSQSDASDDVVAWNAKIKLPRMKMYADVEEKRRKVHPKRQMEVREDAQWDLPKRDEGLPRKPKGSIFSRLGGGDGLGRHVPPENFREREFVARGDWAGEAERPSKRYRAENHEPRGAGGMRSEVKTVRSIKARLGGGVRHY